MFVELGHFALVFALILSLVQFGAAFAGLRGGDERLFAASRRAAYAQAGLLAAAFAILMASYARSDFSVLNVVMNSHSAKPMLFKLTGTWGNHEGSMLLWTLVLSVFGALAAAFANVPVRMKARVIGVQAGVCVLFIAFLLFTSNPFERIWPAPVEGQDLNPLLQDLGLAIHPPLLYVGYVGVSVVFSFAVAALLEGRVDAAWARWVRPWVLTSWIFLTLGISMGSYWAYYELGWGGWWFWDPVENASLLPWLAVTALLHCVIVLQTRGAMPAWTVFLALLAFSLSLLGTFLVRSGVLTSVHAFATDPTRGVVILGILLLTIGGSLALFAWRAPLFAKGAPFRPISREGALLSNNLLLSAACLTVLIGTLYPLGLEALTGRKISVGPPFFNAVFLPLTLPLAVLIPLGGLLAWKTADARTALRSLMPLFLAIVLVVLIAIWRSGGAVLASMALGLGLWLLVGSFAEIATRAMRGDTAREKLARLAAPSMWSSTLGHAGLGLFIIGAVGATAYETVVTARMSPGDRVELGTNVVTFERFELREGPNYVDRTGVFTLSSDGDTLATVAAAERFYPSRDQDTTEAGIATRGVSQFYVTIGDKQDGSWAVRTADKPLVLLIWIGTLVMSAGAAITVARRVRLPRLRQTRMASAHA